MRIYRDYEDKHFYSNLKYARRMFLVATIISLVMLIVDIVYLACELPGSVFLEWNFSVVCYYCCFAFFYPIIMFLSVIKIKKSPSPETKWFNDYSNLLSSLIFIFLPIIFSLFCLYDLENILDYAEMLGKILIEYIFLAIGTGFMLRSAIIAKHDLEIHPPEYKRAEIEQKQAEQRILNEKMNLQNYRDLVDIAGKKFFLKNYYIIRDLSFADAMDSIDDKYSYEDKEKRVQAVKKIFSLNLQKFALEKILQEATGEINAEIKAEAEKIYKKEFPEIVTDTATESIAEEAEENKSKEIS